MTTCLETTESMTGEALQWTLLLSTWGNLSNFLLYVDRWLGAKVSMVLTARQKMGYVVM